MAKYDKLIESTLSEADFDERDNICVTCPKCGKKKFYFSRDKGVGVCFVCDYRVNALSLIMDITGDTYERALMKMHKLVSGRTKTLIVPDAEKEDNKLSEDAYILNRIFESIMSQGKETVVDGSVVALPEDSKPALGSKVAMTYLTDVRGLLETEVARYDLRYVPMHSSTIYAGHVVFPNYGTDGKLNFWTTRATFEPKYGPKSYNPSGVRRKGVLFGHSRLRRNLDALFIVEGPMDCVCLGGRAVALLGSNMSEEQLSVIRKVNASRIVVALDADEAGSAKRMRVARALQEACDAPVFVCLKYDGAKDPAGVAQMAKAGSKVIAARLKQNIAPYSVALEIKQSLR